MNTALILFAWNLGLLFPMALAAWCLSRIPFFWRRPALCHAVWLLVLLKFLTPPLIAVPLLPGLVRTEDPELATSVSPSESPEFTKEMKPVTDRFVLPEADIVRMPDRAPSLLEEPTDLGADASFFTLMGYRQWVLFGPFALSGVMTLLLWAVAWRQLRRIRRLLRSGLDGSDLCSPMLEELAKRFGLRTSPKVCLIDSEISPMLWAEPGRPVILLPRAFIDKLSREELQWVLSHELAHYLRRDHWSNLFAFLVTSLFWWHSVAWFARRELIQASESACDALVLKRLHGSRKSYAQTLLKVVDFVATRTAAQTSWVSHFGGGSPLGRRIEMLATSSVMASMPRSGWPLLLVLGLAFSLLPVRGRNESRPNVAAPTLAKPVVDPSAPIASGRFFVQGTVVEKNTGRPIANASLNFAVDGEMDEEKRRLTTVCDAEGRFRLAVPQGVVQLWNPELKPGYWLPYDEATVTFNTSLEQPIAQLEIKARRGAVWPIKIKTDQPEFATTSLVAILTEEEDDIRRTKLLNREDPGSSPSSPSPATSARFDQDGKGLLTQCGASGKFYLAVGELFPTDLPSLTLEPVVTELIAEPQFDPAKVKTVASNGNTDLVELVDERGKKAQIRKAMVSLEGGQARITFHLKQREPEKQNEAGHHDVVGLVVDNRGQPLADVEVRGHLHTESSGGEIPGMVKTDRFGRYRYRLPTFLTSHLAKPSLALLFRKEGYSTSSSRAFPLPKTPMEAIDAATQTLQPGHSLSFLVVDRQGNPIAGAPVNVSGDHFADWLTLRTDAAGRGSLSNLPHGLAQVHVTNGKLHAHYSVVISSVDAENKEHTFRFNPHPEPKAPFKLPTPLEVGKPAPEWGLDGWSDGKKRTLADLRGKWIVLHFWSMAWDPSVRMIPFWQGVAGSKPLKDVVFIAVHTPGGDPVQIERLRKSTGWKALTAIDRGTHPFDGATALSYGARNPGLFIIDPEGKIAYNDVLTKALSPAEVAERERESKELATSLKIPWPLPEGDDETAEAARNRFACAYFGRTIEKLMRPK